MTNNIITAYQVHTYIADGKTISSIETCDTANEAIARAEKWRAIRTKATAYKVVLDLTTYNLDRIPLN
jgi:hypothetical protein